MAPLDVEPKDPAATGVSVKWLREQLASCRARVKLLVLDACHAGSEKGEEEAPAVTAKNLGEPFREVEGVVTLASCTAGQKSLTWEVRQQSLCSYWLNQGLEGHADVDGDGAVDFDELNKYVHRNVTQTAKAGFQRSQTPVRIMRGLPGVPHVVRLSPLSLNQLLSDMAEQFVLSMEERRIQKVACCSRPTRRSTKAFAARLASRAPSSCKTS